MREPRESKKNEMLEAEDSSLLNVLLVENRHCLKLPRGLLGRWVNKDT